MKQYLYLLILIVAIIPATSFAQDTAKADGEDSLAITYGVSAPPGLLDLNRCATGVASRIFDRKQNTLIQWQAKKGYSNPIVYPPVAISAYVDSEKGPYFLTITPNSILATRAESQERIDKTLGRTSRAVQVTLNLTGRIDPRTELPIVDERESISSSWFQEFTLDSIGKGSNTVVAWQKFRKADLQSPYNEINPSDALLGDQAKFGMGSFRKILRHRVLDVTGALAASLKGNLGDSVLKDLKDGLCSCDGVIAETKEVKEQLLSEKSPLRAWPRNEAKPRRILEQDLACGK